MTGRAVPELAHRRGDGNAHMHALEQAPENFRWVFPFCKGLGAFFSSPAPACFSPYIRDIRAELQAKQPCTVRKFGGLAVPFVRRDCGPAGERDDHVGNHHGSFMDCDGPGFNYDLITSNLACVQRDGIQRCGRHRVGIVGVNPTGTGRPPPSGGDRAVLCSGAPFRSDRLNAMNIRAKWMGHPKDQEAQLFLPSLHQRGALLALFPATVWVFHLVS